MKTCNRCLFDERIATIGDSGQCEYCDLHDKLEQQAPPELWQTVLKQIKKRKGRYNCVMGISGGIDSSTLLWMAVKLWKLRPLVIHFDNYQNSPEAEHNMRNLVRHLNVDSIVYRVNDQEYWELVKAFRFSGTPDLDIPYDMVAAHFMYDTANRYGIKYILNGHCFRTEGSSPRAWTYMDARYVNSVYETLTGKQLKTTPLLTFKNQLIYSLKGIQQIRPFHFIADRKPFEKSMKEEIGWMDYGHKHNENKYTAWASYFLLPGKFGINKTVVYLSAQMRSGMIDRQQALAQLNKPMPTINTHWNWDDYIADRNVYQRYNFKKYRPLIWLLAKLKVVPYTFYVKYCF